MIRELIQLVQKHHGPADLKETEAELVRRGRSALEKQARLQLVRAFRHLSKHAPDDNCDTQLFQVADFLFRSALSGPIVVQGASQEDVLLKLSWMAKLTGRRALSDPAPPSELKNQSAGAVAQRSLVSCSTGALAYTFDGGSCLTGSSVVPDTATDEMPERAVSCFFLDVEQVSLAQDYLRLFWCNLAQGGRIYFPQARDVSFVYGITNANWWSEELGDRPPVLMGTTCLTGEQAFQFAYFQKCPPPQRQS